MASRKELKKDIDHDIFDLISDCYGLIHESPDKDLSGFEQIINDAMELKEGLVTRINKFDSSEAGVTKKYFNEIKADLAAGLKLGYEKLKVLVD